MKLLIVEDEKPTAAFLRRGLSEEGFAIPDVAADAQSADSAVGMHDYDLIVLDVMLPGGDGFSLCQRWRAAGVTTPILFLRARDDVADRVRRKRPCIVSTMASSSASLIRITVAVSSRDPRRRL